MNKDNISVPTMQKYIRVAETPRKLSTSSSEKYLRDALTESRSLLEKLSSIPKINDQRKVF